MSRKEIVQYLVKQMDFIRTHATVLDLNDLEIMAEGIYESIKNLEEN